MAVPVAAIMALVQVLVKVGEAAAAQAKTPYDTDLERKKAELERYPGLDPREWTEMEGKLLDPVLAAITENQSKAEATLAAVGATAGADIQQAEEAKQQFILDAVSKATEQMQSADVRERRADEEKGMAISKAQEQRRADRQAALWGNLGGAAQTGAAWAAEPENIAAVQDAVGQMRKKKSAEGTPAAPMEKVQKEQLGVDAVMGLTDEQLSSWGFNFEEIENFRRLIPSVPESPRF